MHIDRKNGYTHDTLMDKYNVGRSTVQKVLNGSLWEEIFNEFKRG
jgi:hypothetical protein